MPLRHSPSSLLQWGQGAKWFVSVVALCPLLLGCAQAKPATIVYRYVGDARDVPFLAAKAKVEREKAWVKKDYENYNYYVGFIDGLKRSLHVEQSAFK